MVLKFEIADLPPQVIRYGAGLWRRRWTVATVAAATALLTWGALWLIPDQYASRAQVYVQTETVLDPVMTGVTARPNYERRVDVMRLQLLTRPNVEEIILRAGFDREITATDPRERSAQMERLIDWVASQIAITSPQELYFVIDYKNSDPSIARNVVEASLNLLIEQDLGASLTENEEARQRLDAEIAAFDERLTAKEQEIAAFRRLNAEELALVEGQGRGRELMEAEFSRVTDELAVAERRVATARSLLSQTSATSSGSELDRLMVELAGLRSQYNDDYPDIQALKARIAQLQAGSVNQLPDNPEYKRLSAELRAAQDIAGGLADRQKRLKADLESVAVTQGQGPRVTAELQRIERDYEQTRKNYEELLERRDRLSITANLGAGTQGVEYKIFERPTVSLVPSSPPRLVLVALATLASIGAGLGAGLLLIWMQKTFTQGAELQTAFGLPVLGALSEIGSDAVVAERRQDRQRLALGAAAFAALLAFYVYWEVFRLPVVAPDGAPSASLTAETAGRLR
ncbi:MAG: XrtA system polysaccharide chain length determinant [Parvularculaceae bacterium]|nr:XrtA system polysaccharide chain length determinant [Parvularculaceae bacterium]